MSPVDANILVIDDLRTFAKLHAAYARTSADGIRMLEEQAWQELWLDHDLGDDDDIEPVVTWLEQRWHETDAVPVMQVIVHSANPPGAQRVVRALERIVPTRRVNVFEIEHTS